MKPNTQERRLGGGLRCFFTQPTTVMVGLRCPFTQPTTSLQLHPTYNYNCDVGLRCPFTQPTTGRFLKN